MFRLFFIISLLITASCSKPKTVLICGDHECINNKEANLYFEENLSLEVKIIDNKRKNIIDLVELNLNNTNQKKVSIIQKKKTRKEVKKLSKTEIKKIKKQISEKKLNENIIENKKKKTNQLKVSLEKKRTIKKKDKSFESDICKILDKCNIEEISKYLIKKGKKDNFPDITIRE